MICNQLTNMLGLECVPLNDAGDVAQISTPFRFNDGDGFPVFIESIGGNQIRFFDDGETIVHFISRGLNLDDGKRTQWLKKATETHGATLNKAGEIEVWSSIENAPIAFANYISTMNAITEWEREHEGTSFDASTFVEEVVIALRAKHPEAEIVRDCPPIKGISGKSFNADLMFNHEFVLTTSPHPNAVSAQLHKMVDAKALIENKDMRFLVVIDDRNDHEAAKRESLILQSVASVVQFISLDRTHSSVAH